MTTTTTTADPSTSLQAVVGALPKSSMLNHEYALQEPDEDDDHDRDILPPADSTNTSTNKDDDDVVTDDTAGLVVMLYLLFISTLFIGTILGGFFIVVQYGFVVLIAVIVAAFGMIVVAATVLSAVAQEKTLMRAKSKIKCWHAIVKDEIMKEIENLKEDIAAYHSGNLLLLTYIDRDDVVGTNWGTSSNEKGVDVVDGAKNVNASKKNKTMYAPRSLLFSAFSTLRKRKRKSNNSVIVEECAGGSYESPTFV